jgi:hypothetical protein
MPRAEVLAGGDPSQQGEQPPREIEFNIVPGMRGE